MAAAETTTLVVNEQYDGEGDLVYALSLRTYSRQAIRELENLLQTEAVFQTSLDVS
jgi:hypothetical protein